MSSELEDAFAELQDAKAEVTGKREFVLLNGRKIKAIVSEISTDEAFIAGGVAEQGQFRVSIAQSAVAQQPEKDTPIQCRKKKLVVMECADVNGVTFEITAGDPAAEV